MSHGILLPGRHVLFMDDRFVAKRPGAVRRVEKAVKHPANPVLKSSDYEKCFQPGSSVVYDTKHAVYRMWCNISNYRIVYAESRDGIHWKKPLFNIVRVKGRKTNIVIQRGENEFGETPFYEGTEGMILDPTEPDSKQRYKLFIRQYHCDRRKAWDPRFLQGGMARRSGTGLATSADGIHFRYERDFMTEAPLDISYAMFDPYRQEYVLYARDNIDPARMKALDKVWGRGRHASGRGMRAVCRATSINTYGWSPHINMYNTELNDPPGAQIYSMSVFAYEGLYIGQVQTYVQSPGSPLDGVLEIHYAVSHDGIHFQRVNGYAPFLSAGEVGEWDRFYMSQFAAPIVRKEDVLFYYSGNPVRHGPYDGRDTAPSWDGYIGLATARRDRFASLTASYDGGLVVTKPFCLIVPEIHLNFCAQLGNVEVSVLNANGRPIPGLTAAVTGDSLDERVPFTAAALKKAVGRTVQLQFQLKNARLYSFWMPNLKENYITAWPDQPLPIIRQPAIDANLQVRAGREPGRYVFYVQNPGQWPVKAEVELAQADRNPVLRLGTISQAVQVKRQSGHISLQLDLPPLSGQGFAVSSPNAKIVAARIKRLPATVAQSWKKRLHDNQWALTHRLPGLLLRPREEKFCRGMLQQIARAVDQQRLVEAEKLWQNRRFKLFRDYIFDFTLGHRKAEKSAAGRPWLVIGPFSNKNKSGYQTAYPPEQAAFDSSARYRGLYGLPVRWFLVHEQDGELPLDKVFYPWDEIAVYARTSVYSPRTQKAKILFGSDDGGRVWVNGKPVFAFLDSRGFNWGPGRKAPDVIPVVLKSGWNTILVKALQDTQGFRAALDLVDRQGRKIKDLRYGALKSRTLRQAAGHLW